MTKSEFIKKINNGRDILFDINGHQYGIFTWCENGIGVGESTQNVSKDPLQYYNTPKDLLENYKVNGTPLADLCDKVIITDYT